MRSRLLNWSDKIQDVNSLWNNQQYHWFMQFILIYILCFHFNSFWILRYRSNSWFNTTETCSIIWKACIGRTLASDASRCPSSGMYTHLNDIRLLFSSLFLSLFFFCTSSRDQSVHPRRQPIYERCKHAYQHISEIRHWRLFGSWVLI